tara:strand:+ start:57902 stop:58375 length:474 start_codon:yes stop_codon:yes gene_type:complete
MRENVLDVLMYLFETYIETQDETEMDHEDLRLDLTEAGFNSIEIEKAFDWLDKLNHENSITADLFDVSSNRVYSRIEMSRLSSSCRGFIEYLEQINILTFRQRELLIDRLLALNTYDINIDQIKWIVLMILFSQPNQEKAYSRMEDLIFETNEGVLH